MAARRRSRTRKTTTHVAKCCENQAVDAVKRRSTAAASKRKKKNQIPKVMDNRPGGVQEREADVTKCTPAPIYSQRYILLFLKRIVSRVFRTFADCLGPFKLTE